jgi:lipopolysaccharide/colanic/teichoic acid biosynthesis glycosyltransferase
MMVAENKDSRFDVGDISRVTFIGKFLRLTKLDEIPQLLNVVKGNISLVGPRPEVRNWVNVYPERWKIVLKVKPGITDIASILFRNEEKILAQSINPIETYKNIILPQKLDYYENYVYNSSFWGDVKLILLTICVIIFPNINLIRISKINGK